MYKKDNFFINKTNTSVHNKLYTYPTTLPAVLRGCVREYSTVGQSLSKDDSCWNTLAIYIIYLYVYALS